MDQGASRRIGILTVGRLFNRQLGIKVDWGDHLGFFGFAIGGGNRHVAHLGYTGRPRGNQLRLEGDGEDAINL